MIKPTPIAEILRRIRPLAAKHKADHLRALISLEPKRGIRRREIEDALKHIVNRELRKESREDAA
jgi:hypothetical protein